MGGEGGDAGTRAGAAGSNGARDRVAKLFVLDTNVILHDARCIQSFREHDVAIPITVLEELDRFKRGSNDLNAQAREFLGKRALRLGVSLDDDAHLLRVRRAQGALGQLGGRAGGGREGHRQGQRESHGT